MASGLRKSTPPCKAAPAPEQVDDMDAMYLDDYRDMFAIVPELGTMFDVGWKDGEGKFLVARKDMTPEEPRVQERASADVAFGYEDPNIIALETVLVRWSSTGEAGNEDVMARYPGLPWKQWLDWQRKTSERASIGLVSLANCLIHIAEVAVASNFETAMRPFERLCDLPPHGQLVFSNTSIEELAGMLRKDCFGRAPFAGLDKLQLCSGGVDGATVGATGAVGSSSRPSSDAQRHPTGLQDTVFSVPFLESLAGRLSQNSVGYGQNSECSGNAASVGGLFVMLSLCNHDCDPNLEVVAYPDGKTIGMRLIKEVTAGDRLTISYCPSVDELAARQERLGHWFFVCKCRRCETEGALLACVEKPGDASAACSGRQVAGVVVEGAAASMTPSDDVEACAPASKRARLV